VQARSPLTSQTTGGKALDHPRSRIGPRINWTTPSQSRHFNLFSIMSQSHYHVFLPPSLSSLSPPTPRISFQDLTVSRELESQLDFGHASQVSRLKRISQSESQPRASGHIDRKGKAKEEPSSDYIDGLTTQYSWPPTPLEVIGSGTSKKRTADDGNTSRGNTIKKSRAPLTLSGNTATADTTEDQDVSVDVGEASGSRRRSSRVRRSGSGMSTSFRYHLRVYCILMILQVYQEPIPTQRLRMNPTYPSIRQSHPSHPLARYLQSQTSQNGRYPLPSSHPSQHSSSPSPIKNPKQSR